MARRSAPNRLPKYRLHKPTGLAVVSLDGRDFYLGMHGSKASKAEYDRLTGEWLAHGRRLPRRDVPTDLTVNELLAAYWQHCETYYVKNGKPTKKLGCIRSALSPVRRLYGTSQVNEFGPAALKAIRQTFIDGNLSRATVNEYTGWIKACFRWGVEESMVPSEVWHGLQAVRGLRKGRSEARETGPVRPVADAVVDATLVKLPSMVADMVRVQRLTGMRPGEVCSMTTGEIDMSGAVWLYRPGSHKTEHHDIERVIAIGPRAQSVIGPYLRKELDQPIFSPAESERRRFEALKASSNSHPSCNKSRDAARANSRRKRQRPPSEWYTSTSYRRAIVRAAERAGVGAWSPNQLRHTRATELRKSYGIDAAGAVLGHTRLETSQIYAERSLELATRIAGEIG